MTDSAGALVSSISYSPFGTTRGGFVPTDIKFTGQRLDGTGLYYYGARYYDPSIGRFISADIVVQNPTYPQSLNRYSYVLNNPLKYTDPTGHWVFGLDDVMTTEEQGMPVAQEVWEAAIAFEEFREKEPDVALMLEQSDAFFDLELDEMGNLELQLQRIHDEENFTFLVPFASGEMRATILAAWNNDVLIVNVRISASITNIGGAENPYPAPGATVGVGSGSDRQVDLRRPDGPAWSRPNSSYVEGEIAVGIAGERRARIDLQMSGSTGNRGIDEIKSFGFTTPFEWTYSLRLR